MAVKRKVTRKRVTRTKPTNKYEIPTVASNICESLSEYSILLYGAKKIGKTSLCARFDDPLFFCFEPGVKGLRVKSVHPGNFEEALGYLESLKEMKEAGNLHKTCKNIIIDTADMLYECIFNTVCDELGVENPRDMNDFGKTWRKIRKAYRDFIYDIINLGVGVILISHETEREIELRNGDTTERIEPTMSKQALEEVEGIVDIIFHYTYELDERFIQLRGSQTVVAGCRLEENFQTPKGMQVKTISMGNSAKESYENLITAYNNEQEHPNPANLLRTRHEKAKEARRAKLRKKG